ncbi:LysR family transcriptional regulator [Cereibacter johrii]|nr:LysR family transcriptional regulator [Cereibacter johrii]
MRVEHLEKGSRWQVRRVRMACRIAVREGACHFHRRHAAAALCWPARAMPGAQDDARMTNLKSLEVFFWVAKLRSFSVAAEKLNMTQPTVSQRISALEEGFGQQLINRKSKPISLTDPGLLLLRHCEVILRQVAAMNDAMGVREREARTIRLGVSETIAQAWLTQFLKAVRRVRPNLEFEIQVDVTSSLEATLLDGELDLAFMLGPMALNDFACLPLGAYPLQFYGLSHLVPSGRLRNDDFLSIPILTYPKRAYPYGALREAIMRLTGEPPKFVTSTSLATIRRMVLDGMGVALVAQDMIQTDGSAPGLVRLESPISLDPLSFYAFHRIGEPSRLLEDLCRLAQRVAAREVPLPPPLPEGHH